MRLFDRLKRVLGIDESPPEAAGEEVTVHIEHPSMETESTADLETTDLEDVKGIGPTYADRLRDAGIDDVATLAAASPADLAEATDVSETRLATWIERARAHREGP